MTQEMGLESCCGMTSFPQVNIVGAHMSLPFQIGFEHIYAAF
jgi:hypothetical protein